MDVHLVYIGRGSLGVVKTLRRCLEDMDEFKLLVSRENRRQYQCTWTILKEKMGEPGLLESVQLYAICICF